MTSTFGAPPGSLVYGVAMVAQLRRDRLLVAALIALAMHGGLGILATRHEPQAVLEREPVDVELAFREPPPPEGPKPVEPPERATPKPIAKLAPPPPAARAGAVLTALPDPLPARAATEPVDFTNDPNHDVYGNGVVAVGGTGTHGLAGARLGGSGEAPVRPRHSADGLIGAADWSRKPRLPNADPCRGFFPGTAHDDMAVVAVRVIIGNSGRVSSAEVLSESPPGQGFGSAARHCMLDQVFVPALDRAGKAAATALAVNVRFSR